MVLDGRQLLATMYKWRAEQGLTATHLFCWCLWAPHKPKSLVGGPTILPVSGMFSKCPYHTLHCSHPSFGLWIHSCSSGESVFTACLHMCSPSTASSSLLYGHHCLSRETIRFLKAEARPVSCTSALPGTVHAMVQNVVNIC